MSISTWKKEFYPTPASRCSKKNALAHSLRKWEGLLKKNLRKHGVTWDDAWGLLNKSGDSCALCMRHRACVGCPICVAGLSCVTVGNDGLFDKSFDNTDARPMVYALRKLVREAG